MKGSKVVIDEGAAVGQSRDRLLEVIVLLTTLENGEVEVSSMWCC